MTRAAPRDRRDAGTARSRGGADDAVVGPRPAARAGGAVRRDRRRAQALARRGDVRPAAGGLPHGRDVRGDRRSPATRSTSSTARTGSSSTGTTRAAPRRRSTCWRATARCCTACAGARWRPRGVAVVGAGGAVHGAGAASASAATRRRPPTAGTAQLMADLRTGTQELQRPLSERRVLGQAMKKVEGILGMPGLSQLVAARRRTPVRQLLTVGMHTLLLIAAARRLPARARIAVGRNPGARTRRPGTGTLEGGRRAMPRVASTALATALSEFPQPGVEGVRAHVADCGARDRHTVVRPPAAVEHGVGVPRVARRFACRFVDVDSRNTEWIGEARRASVPASARCRRALATRSAARCSGGSVARQAWPRP